MAVLGWLSPPAEPAGPLLVSAAISLTEALSACGASFTASTGIPVRFNFGPSNALARQIVEGAPVDVFVSADEAQMQFAARSGAVTAGDVRIIATNRLAIVVAGRRETTWSSAAPLSGPGVKRVAVGDPRAVPAGVYAKRWLQTVGQWNTLESKLVPTTSVRGALAAVRSGAADAGIVYITDARIADGVRVVYEVTGPDAPTIVYPASVVTRSRHAAEARRFVAFLQGKAGQRILERHGFGPARIRISR